MPVDIHPQEKLSGVELILTRLHAGGKFSNKNYQFSGGLHGVGVSVVNALSKNLEVWIRRDGKEYNMSFADGERRSKLEVVGKVGEEQHRHDGALLAEPEVLRLAAVLAAALEAPAAREGRAVPGPRRSRSRSRSRRNPSAGSTRAGSSSICEESLGAGDFVPEQPFAGKLEGKREAVEWAVVWRRDGGEVVLESYVNLIPTPQGGTHVNGMRTGLTDALREFCEFRNLLPRGIKLAPEDVWEGVSFVLSVKIEEPQFSGQTKERLSSRECAHARRRRSSRTTSRCGSTSIPRPATRSRSSRSRTRSTG